MTAFENFGRRDAEAADQMECGVCWHVYDPAVGDEVAQIPPGTSFSQLPDSWRCPNCDGPADKYIRIEEGR